MIEHDDLSAKPGWIRMSLHPIMTDEEIEVLLSAIEELSINYRQWAADYIYDAHENIFMHKTKPQFEITTVEKWFE